MSEQPLHPETIRPHPLVFGEVLFDCFPDGTATLGGAPFNVAWHLQGFGLAPLLISRVGDDDRGVQVKRAMKDWGLDIGGLQTDPTRATGEVVVTLVDGQPDFDIVADRAWDAIDADAAEAAIAARPPDLLYHGSLALRAGPSREALIRLRETAGAPVFLDVNLRPPWWDRRDIRALMDGATWVKLNDTELRELTDAGEDLSDAARGLAAAHDLEGVIVTRGAEGALWASREGILATVRSRPLSHIVDTVGAGDAFSSVCILGLLSGWPLERILPEAHEFAAGICGNRGAISGDPHRYRL